MPTMIRKGRPRDYAMVAKVAELRRQKDNKGRRFSFRRIARELDRDVKTVHRWAKYAAVG